MLIEIAEKDEEEDTSIKNNSLNKYKNEDINNKDIYFSPNKKIILNTKMDNESKNNDIKYIEEYNTKNNRNRIYKNSKENDIFNNFLSNKIRNSSLNKNKSNLINYLGYSNKDNNTNLKSNFNYFLTEKNIPNDTIYKYKKYNSNDDNIRYKITNEKNNIFNKKLSLPNLNFGKYYNKKSLSSNKNQNKLNLEEMPKTELDEIKKYNYYSPNHHYKLKENNKEKNDNFQITLLSTFSNSNNIIIPIISSQKKSRNNLNYENEKNYENNQIFNDIKTFNKLTKSTEENKINNNINEIIKNKVNEPINKNYLLQNKNKEKGSLKKNNLFLNIENTFMSKLHKIKIQKGIMGNKIFEKLKNNLLAKEHIYYSKTESSSNNNKLPLIKKLYE